MIRQRQQHHPKHHPVRRASAARAFTLMELLVSLAVVAIISVSLFGSVEVAFKARKSAEAALNPAQRASVAMEIIRNDLANALPPNPNSNTVTNPNSTTIYLVQSFIGNSAQNGNYRDDDLVFYTATDGPAHADGDCDVKQVELTVKPPDNPQLGKDPVLVRRVISNLLLPQTQQQQPEEEVICRGVVGFQLRYFDGTNWDDTWNTTQANNALPMNSLPIAVEVTLFLQASPDQPGKTTQCRRVFVLSTFPPSNESSNSLGNLGLPGGF